MSVQRLNTGRSSTYAEIANSAVSSSTYQGSTANVANNATANFNIEPVVDQSSVLQGIMTRVQITSSSLGQVTLELFEDAARSDSRRIRTLDVDVSTNPISFIPASFNSENATGILYASITNLTGAETDITVDVNFLVISVVGSSTQSVVSPELATDPGLELDGLNRLRAKVGDGLDLDANGIKVDTTVLRTSGAQSIDDIKTFNDAVVLAPHPTDSGAPTAGTYTEGAIFTDVDGNKWLCTASGTPGTWVFWGSRLVTYDTELTGTVAAGGSVTIEIPTIGRRGIISRLRVFAQDDLDSTYDIPFRVAIYSKETLLGRDRIALLFGYSRKVRSSSTITGGSTTINVETLGSILGEDLVYIADTSEPTSGSAEYNRISGTGTLQLFTYDELLNSYDVQSSIIKTEEYSSIHWYNDTLTAAEKNKLFMVIINDHATLSTSFGYDLVLENLGGQQ